MRRKLLLMTFFVISILLTGNRSYGQSWQSMGPNDLDELGFGSSTGMAVDKNGVVYVTYKSYGTNTKIQIKKYLPAENKWVAVGNAEGVSAGGTDAGKIAVNSTGVPYVAYQDQTNSYKAIVLKYDSQNNSWVQVGSAVSPGRAEEINFAFDKDDVPYVSYSDNPGQSKLAIKRFINNSWQAVGSEWVSTSNMGNSVMTILGTNVYVAYSDGDKGNKLTVRKYNGSTWSTLGTTGFTSNFVSNLDIVADKNNIPYVIYTDYSLSDKVSVQKFANNAWTYVGSAGFSNGRSTWKNKIIMDADGTTPVIIYHDYSLTSVITQKFSSNKWSVIGQNTFPKQADGFGLAKNAAGELYAVYENRAGGARVEVKKLTNNVWVSLGTSGLHNYLSAGRIKLDNNGIPYVLYMDAEKDNKLTLRKFNTTTNTWDIVGARGFTAGSGYNAKLSIKSNNEIYVAYADQSNGNKLYVSKFNGSAWSVPGGVISSENTTNFDIKVSSNGTPYVSYVSYTAGNDLLVKKLDGSSWVNAGSGKINIEQTTSFSLALDAEDNPYIYFNDVSSKEVVPGPWGSMTVYKYKTFGKKLNPQTKIWDTVESNISSTGEDVQSIYTTISTKGDIFSAYIWGTNPQKLTIKKYDGESASWKAIGEEGQVISGLGLFSITTDVKGTPYIGYKMTDGIKSAAIKKYNSNNDSWEIIGSEIESPFLIEDGFTYDIDASGKIYSAYSRAGLYVKTYEQPNFLPVVLTAFTAKAQNNNALIEWKTSSETNSSHFVLERSINGKDFRTINTIKSTGSESTPASYSFTDFTPANGQNYYRLTQFDKDGTETNHGVRVVNFSLKEQTVVKVYPNPIIVNINTTVSFPSGIYTKAMLTDISGKIINTVIISDTAENIIINTESIPAGIYFIRLSGRENTVVKMIK